MMNGRVTYGQNGVLCERRAKHNRISADIWGEWVCDIWGEHGVREHGVREHGVREHGVRESEKKKKKRT